VAFGKERNLRGGFIGRVALLLFLSLSFGIFVVYLSRAGGSSSVLREFLAAFYDLAKQHPWFLVLSLLFLPTFGVPIAPLLILAGSCWNLEVALKIVFVCIGFNLIFSYFFYKRYLNRFLMKLIFRKKQIRQPRPNTRFNSLRWCLLIQFIPHLPYSVQCYILAALKEVRFCHYLAVSWLVQFIWAVGFVCGGRAIYMGHFGLTIFCVFLVVVYVMYRCFYLWRRQGKNTLEN
jgi:uncharacterized membrane protein YdjX (TVP38/TMEM64 family)